MMTQRMRAVSECEVSFSVERGRGDRSMLLAVLVCCLVVVSWAALAALGLLLKSS